MYLRTWFSLWFQRFISAFTSEGWAVKSVYYHHSFDTADQACLYIRSSYFMPLFLDSKVHRGKVGRKWCKHNIHEQNSKIKILIKKKESKVRSLMDFELYKHFLRVNCCGLCLFWLSNVSGCVVLVRGFIWREENVETRNSQLKWGT